MNRRLNPWKPEEEGRLREAWPAKVSVHVLAAEFGRTPASIYNKVEDMGMRHARAGDQPHKWPDDDVAVLRRMWFAGATSTEVSKALDGRRSASAVGNQARKLGLVRAAPVRSGPRPAEKSPAPPPPPPASANDRDLIAAAIAAGKLTVLKPGQAAGTTMWELALGTASYRKPMGAAKRA